MEEMEQHISADKYHVPVIFFQDSKSFHAAKFVTTAYAFTTQSHRNKSILNDIFYVHVFTSLAKEV